MTENTNKKILFVLKDRDWSNRLVSQARGRQYEADQAFLGFQAVHLFEKSKYDLIIADYKLTDMYGIEVLSLYQSWPDTLDTTVLAITGRPKQITEIKDQIDECGWTFIQKPYEDLELFEFLEAEFEKKKEPEAA
jgi:DNA-binding response OmpR family regulator